VMCDMMRDVVSGGTAAAAYGLGVHFPTGGKTGTTNKYTDAWFCGFSAYMTSVVWVGFDDKTIIGYGQTGSRAALPIWARFMAKAHEGLPERWIEKPPGVFSVTICLDSGLRATAQCINTKTDIASTPPTEEVCMMDHSRGEVIHFVDESAFYGYNPEDPPPLEYSHF
jgi:penicillin-binding protein 1A